MSDAKTVSGKVASVQAAGHFTSKTGRDAGKTKYKFDVLLDGGERGQLACLQSELNGTDAPIAVGETHEFNVYASTNPEYPDNWYLRKPKAEGGWKGGKQWTPDPEKENRKERWAKQIMITRQACLNTASALIANGGGEASFESMTGIAAKLEQWVVRGLNLGNLIVPGSNPVQNGTPPQAAKPAPKPEPALADRLGEQPGDPF